MASIKTLRQPYHPVFDNRMDKHALVTIFIPTFHRGRTLQFALESALRQQHDLYPIDILVVDNEPDPGQDVTHTAVLMETYRHVTGLAYMRNEQNYGATGNWNQGYSLARTEWVVMLHDDDTLAPEYCAVLHNLVRAFPRSSLFTFEGETIHTDTGATCFAPGENRAVRLRRSDFLLRNPCFVVGIALRRSMWQACGGFDTGYMPSIDYKMWSAVICCAEVVKFLPASPLTHYHIADNDSSRVETSIGLLDSDSRLREELLADSPWLMRRLWRHYFRGYVNHWIEGVIGEMHSHKPPEALAAFRARKITPTILDKIIFIAFHRYFDFSLKCRKVKSPIIK